MYDGELADRKIKRLLITSDIILSLVMLGNLLYTRAVSNQVSKLQGQVDSLYKTMNSEKNKKDDKLLDKK